jgi:thiol-disulfide isomerase/thioredoxin
MKKLNVFLILFFCLFCTQLVSQTTIGQKAPALSELKLIDKQLPALENKFVFIDFWATWCSPCRESLPHVDKLAERYKDNVLFLAISDEKENVVRQFLQNKEFKSLVFGLDIQKNLYSKLEIKAIPQYYLISPQNTILAHGYSSEISDHYLDSVITNYNPLKLTTKNNIKITEDSLEKISSIEISEKAGMNRFLSQSGYTFVVRDSLHLVLPYLTGVRLANRMILQDIPRRMIEVKIFSRNTSFDSLKIVAYNQIMASYGISKSSVALKTTVYDFQLKTPKLLKDKNTFVEPGASKSRNFINDSTCMFDNYTLEDVVNYLEGAYFPRLFYVKNASSEEYDWDLKIVDPVKKNWVSFEKLKAILKNDFGIEIMERKNEETFSIFK